jgi:GrpB-like predicted nucleotidyltransferase (UPF0157 family)
MTECFRIIQIDAGLLAAERDRVLALLKTLLPSAAVAEVGSTAVPGVVGKQDIDVAVRVPEANFSETRDILDAHFSRNETQLSNTKYQGYRVTSPLDIAIQLTVQGCEYDFFDRFLNHLRRDAALRASYNQLKMAWDGKPMDEYRAAKSRFIEAVLRGDDPGS